MKCVSSFLNSVSMGLAFFCLCLGQVDAGKLYVGAANITITPEERVALDGQFRTRISNKVESPCIATAVAIETRNGDESLEQAIFVSCDLVALRGGAKFFTTLREKLKGQIPDEVLSKVTASATHTHTGPVQEDGKYDIPESGVMTPGEYREFLMNQLAAVVKQAWDSREPASMAWGLGRAIIAQNRRAVYANGVATMYGNTNDARFRGMEGTEDHGVELLYFWNEKDQLIATAINVACPSQEVEGRNHVNADFWHPVREALREKHGEQLNVLAWTGAGGDQSPHLMYRKAAEARMQKLRGIDSLQDLANRIVATWEDVYSVVQKDRHSDVEFQHLVRTIQLPHRKLTEAQSISAQKALDAMKGPESTRHRWHRRVVDRYKQQQESGVQNYDLELHAVRLGDIAIATNDFELFTDYGVQMKARSPALQTFVIQLSGSGTYLPSERAAAGGGYSAVAESTTIGPDGGQVLVDKTVEALKELWEAKK